MTPRLPGTPSTPGETNTLVAHAVALSQRFKMSELRVAAPNSERVLFLQAVTGISDIQEWRDKFNRLLGYAALGKNGAVILLRINHGDQR